MEYEFDDTTLPGAWADAQKARRLKMEEWTDKADKARQDANMGQAELIAAVIDAATSAGTLE